MSFTPDTSLVDRVVPSPAGEIWSRGLVPIKGIAVHMAQGGGTENHLDNLDGNSSHYVIKYSGELVQMVPERLAAGSMNPKLTRTDDDPAFTNYLGERIRYGITALKRVLGSFYRDPNRASIAIEIEGCAGVPGCDGGSADPDGGPNDKQEATLVKLVADIRRRRGLLPVFGHKDQQDYKACPGPRIPWKLLGGHAVVPTSEVPMRSIQILDTAAIGRLEVEGSDHSYLLLRDNKLYRVPDGFTKMLAFGPVRISPGIGDNTDARSIGYLVGRDAAFLLDTDVDFDPLVDLTPFDQEDIQAAVNSAKVDLLADLAETKALASEIASRANKIIAL